jgi:uncharacterized repeat protein (TIGR03803 family)
MVSNQPSVIASLTLAILFALAGGLTPPAQAQTYNIIHNFTGNQDGATPMAGLLMDRAGSVYGTAASGGNLGNCGGIGCGVVFRMTKGISGWVLAPLYSFAGGSDGESPRANVVFAPDGSLTGTTYEGGGPCAQDPNGCGTVFKLQPPVSSCRSALCPWMETVLHQFNGNDGAAPLGAVVFDQSGNLYGAASSGGFRNGGTVFELTPSGPDWTSRVIYSPYGYPESGVIFNNGQLYGTAFSGGNGQGSVYQLTSNGSGWMGTNLYDFTHGSDGGYPWASPIFDQAGNLYGSTTAGGSGNGGTVFRMTPSGGNWTLDTLYSFTGPGNGRFVVGPLGSLIMDSAGSLYGTTFADGANKYGAVFKLTPSNGGWTFTSLHDFTGGSDGAYPYSNLVFDASGNIYGTASQGGTSANCVGGCGVVFEITP